MRDAVIVQSLRCVWLFVSPWTAARRASPSVTVSWSLLKLMSIESVMPSNHLILCHPLLLLPLVFPRIRVFSNESAKHQGAKVLEFQHQSFQRIFRIDFLWPVWFPCSPRDSQESSPTPQFKSINSSVLNLPYGPIFCIMYSAYQLNKQGDNILPWRTPLATLTQSIVPCLVLTVASWPAHRFLRRQVRWSGIPISLRMFHSLL